MTTWPSWPFVAADHRPLAVPWCDPCEKYLAPNAVDSEGGCPSCGTAVDTRTVTTAPAAADEDAASGIPWHFWLMLASASIYLLWRAVQGIVLLF